MPNNNIEHELRRILKSGSLFTPENNVFARFQRELGAERFMEILSEEGYTIDAFFDFLKELFSGGQDLFKAVAEEQSKIDALLNPNNVAAVGELLLAHLRLEYLIDKLVTENLKERMDDEVLSKAKISFNQKLHLLPGRNGKITPLIPVIRAINKLRNCFVHDLKFDINNFNNKEIDDIISKEEDASLNKFERIMKLIKGIELYLIFETSDFIKQREEILDRNPVFSKIMITSKDGKPITARDLINNL